MATSGLYGYKPTALDVVTESLGIIGAYAPGETLDPSESADVLRTLEMMIKAWQADHIGMWTSKELSLFLQNDTYSYNIGPTGDHCAKTFAKSELSAAAASGASSITIDATTGFGDTFDRNGIVTATTPTGAGSVALTGALVTSGVATLLGQRNILVYSDGNDSGVTFGITGVDADGVAVTETLTGPDTTTVYSANTYKSISAITIDGAGTGNIEIGCVGDYVGIELTSGSMQWTYIGAALSTTLTLITTLTGAAAIDNHVYSYTVKTPRPVEIIEVRLHDSNDLERPLISVSREEYQMLSDKSSSGTPNQIFYDPQTIEGIMKIWPSCNRVKEYIKFTARLPIQDVDNLSNDFEFPQEWFEALAWNLAVRLYPKYGKPIDQGVLMVASGMIQGIRGFDREYQSSFIQIVNR